MNVGQAKRRVVSHEMAATTRFLRDCYVFCLPQEVGIHRTPGVRAAGIAVAISHRHWSASHLDLDAPHPFGRFAVVERQHHASERRTLGRSIQHAPNKCRGRFTEVTFTRVSL